MNWLELILAIIAIIFSYFAGYGFAAWEEDQNKKRSIRNKERDKIMKGLQDPIWKQKETFQGPYWKGSKK